MTKVKATFEVQFETVSRNAARSALRRIPGDLTTSIEHGATGLTGAKRGSVTVRKIDEEIS